MSSLQSKHYCKYCGSYFSSHFAKKHHMDLLHNPNAIRFKCDHCSYSMVQKDDLKKHLKKHIPDFTSKNQKICTALPKKVQERNDSKMIISSFKRNHLVFSDEEDMSFSKMVKKNRDVFSPERTKKDKKRHSKHNKHSEKKPKSTHAMPTPTSGDKTAKPTLATMTSASCYPSSTAIQPAISKPVPSVIPDSELKV